MRGEEIREFLIELESRFPDFHATKEYAGIINSVETDNFGKEISFYEIVSLLNTLTGHSASSNNNEDERGSGNEQLLQRIHDLEEQVARKDRELQAFRDELVRTRLRDTAVAGRQSSDLGATKGMEKLVMYVPKLLKALQIIDRDRNELYQLHLQVMHEGRAATKEISKRASLERELGKIYSELVDLNPDGIPSELSGMRIADENTVVMNRPRAFILYSFILWIFGALAVFVMRDYIRQSDVLLRFPADPIY